MPLQSCICLYPNPFQAVVYCIQYSVHYRLKANTEQNLGMVPELMTVLANISHYNSTTFLCLIRCENVKVHSVKGRGMSCWIRP